MSKLTIHNNPQRMAFAGLAQNNDVPFIAWFSKEAHFHLDGSVNKKMCNFENTNHSGLQIDN
jgi:hypothetical protein